MLSCVQLFATPWTIAHQAPLSMEFSKQEYWSGLPFPSLGDLSNPGIQPMSPQGPFRYMGTLSTALGTLHFGSAVRNPPAKEGDSRLDPWVRKILWRRKWEPTLVFLPGKSYGQRSLAGYSPWGSQKSQTRLSS